MLTLLSKARICFRGNRLFLSLINFLFSTNKKEGNHNVRGIKLFSFLCSINKTMKFSLFTTAIVAMIGVAKSQSITYYECDTSLSYEIEWSSLPSQEEIVSCIITIILFLFLFSPDTFSRRTHTQKRYSNLLHLFLVSIDSIFVFVYIGLCHCFPSVIVQCHPRSKYSGRGLRNGFDRPRHFCSCK